MGALVSELGALLYNFAVSFYILQISGNSAFLQGLYLALCGVSMLLFTPVGGVLGDRFNKAKIMYVCDCLKGGLILLATALMLLFREPDAHIVILFVLGVLGNVIGTRRLQIALSHSYGKTPQDNCAYTIKTVSNLLQGVPLDLYFSLNMASIAEFNDLLGGVTVTMQEDHTLINPAFTKGATIHLMGKDAYDYVHSRMYVDDGTNTSRMARQRNYMLAAKDTLISRLAHDNAFVDNLFETLGSDLVTNVTRGRLINEAAKASQYKVGEITQMVGEHVIGNNGYMEFHADEQFLIDWVLSVFYREYK